MDARLKSFPKDLTNHLQKIYPPGILPSVLRSYLEPRTTALRVNTLKASVDLVVRELAAVGFLFEVNKQIPNCIFLSSFSQKKLTSLRCYDQGWFYLQNASCQFPGFVLNPQPGERVLDLCASPGGKTSHLAALMKNKGSIVAIEPDRIRFERLKHNLSLLGVTNTECLMMRGETFCRQLLVTNSEKFDRVLVDAPCGGDGTFYINDRASFSHWSIDFVKEKAKTQFKLLSAAVSVTKKGGLVLYTTCSTTPEENELVVENVLNSNKTVQLDDLIILNNKSQILQHPIMSWNNFSHSSQICKCRRIFPSKDLEGFFFALFRVL